MQMEDLGDTCLKDGTVEVFKIRKKHQTFICGGVCCSHMRLFQNVHWDGWVVGGSLSQLFLGEWRVPPVWIHLIWTGEQKKVCSAAAPRNRSSALIRWRSAAVSVSTVNDCRTPRPQSTVNNIYTRKDGKIQLHI